MIQYNPKEWFTFVFKIHKADTVRKLFPLMIAIGVYTFIIVYLEKEYFQLTDKSYVKNIPVLHTILGAVISLLLVFRTNSAYDRWWEGRKLWGELTNTTRSMAIKLNNIISNAHHDRDFFMKALPAFAFALRNHLLSKKPDWELFEQSVSSSFSASLDVQKHIPMQICDMMYARIERLRKEGSISEIQYLTLNDDIKILVGICGACERIKNTPIPFSYSVFIKKFIFGYVMTLPFGYMFLLGYISIPVVIFIFYVLASMELIAEEIEDPFGGDSNDLPTESMSKNIQKNIVEIFSKKKEA